MAYDLVYKPCFQLIFSKENVIDTIKYSFIITTVYTAIVLAFTNPAAAILFLTCATCIYILATKHICEKQEIGVKSNIRIEEKIERNSVDNFCKNT